MSTHYIRTHGRPPTPWPGTRHHLDGSPCHAWLGRYNGDNGQPACSFGGPLRYTHQARAACWYPGWGSDHEVAVYWCGECQQHYAERPPDDNESDCYARVSISGHPGHISRFQRDDS